MTRKTTKDPKKIRHYYVDGSYDPKSKRAASAVLVKGYGFKPYTIVKKYHGKGYNSHKAERKAIETAIEDAKNIGYPLDHVVIHTDQKNLVNGVGKSLSKERGKITEQGIVLKYMPSRHTVPKNSTSLDRNAYAVGELARLGTKGYYNRYTMHLHKRQKMERIQKIINEKVVLENRKEVVPHGT